MCVRHRLRAIAVLAPIVSIGSPIRRLSELDRGTRPLRRDRFQLGSAPSLHGPPNSWATGTNPEVNSLYLRILSQNPSIKGRNFNLAEVGARVRHLVLQAERAVALNPKPELVVIQIRYNDVACPVSARDLSGFRATFVSALEVLADGLPESSSSSASSEARIRISGR